MQDNPLFALFYKIREYNPSVILSGSLALSLQNIKLRRQPEDIDIHLPYGEDFNPPPGLVTKEATTYTDKDKILRTTYFFENDGKRFKVDLFQPFGPGYTGNTVVCSGNILCTEFTEILQFKLNHSFNKTSKKSIKHAVDLIYVLFENTALQNKNLITTIQEFSNHKTQELPSIILPRILLERPLIFFDTETTGVDKSKDRIVELSTIKFFPNGEKEVKTQRFNPTIPIPTAATEVHNITDEDVREKPIFADKAAELAEYFRECDLAGFNIIEFDVPLIVEEFLRCGIASPFQTTTKVLDALKIFYQNEKRDLASAYKFYCDKDLKNAHSAEADTLATVEILNRQLAKYDIENTVEAIHEICHNGSSSLDHDNKFARNKTGIIVFMFGKYKGLRALDFPDYLRWMLTQDFLRHTKYVIKLMLEGELTDNDVVTDDDLPF